MEALGQYIVSVTAAALVCGILQGLLGRTGPGKLLHLVCGLFLAYTVLGPVGRLRLDALEDLTAPTLEAATAAVEAGTLYADEARRTRITEALEAYILDKAKALGADVAAEVRLDEEGLPAAVTITGALAPRERQQLQSAIALELGIPKERQQWNPTS